MYKIQLQSISIYSNVDLKIPILEFRVIFLKESGLRNSSTV